MNEEMWKPVVGFEGIYQVSNHGRVQRIAPAQGTRPGWMLTPMTDRKGYRFVHLNKRMHRVHRLVAAAFFGPSEMLIRHLDGDPTNNTVENLRYGTPLENAADRIAHGRHRHNGRLERTHCRHGHEYTADNVMIKRRAGQRPYRQCRTCLRAQKAEYRARKREQASQG